MLFQNVDACNKTPFDHSVYDILQKCKCAVAQSKETHTDDKHTFLTTQDVAAIANIVCQTVFAQMNLTTPELGEECHNDKHVPHS